MMQFWIGSSQEYVAVEYAKSGRSGCRSCNQKIANNSIRIGLLNDSQPYPTTYWYHKNCYHFQPRHAVLDYDTLEQQIYGIDDLDPEDYDSVLDYLKEELKKITEGKKQKKKPKKSGKQDVADEKLVKKDSAIKKSKKQSKSQKVEEKKKNKTKQSQQKTQQKAVAKRTRSKSNIDAQNNKDDQQLMKKSKGTKKVLPKKAQPSNLQQTNSFSGSVLGPASLFSQPQNNLFTFNNNKSLPSTSLFSNANNAKFHTGSLFSNNSASSSLFGSNLFGNSSAPSLFTSYNPSGLFGSSNQSSGLFPSPFSFNLPPLSPISQPSPSLFSFQNLAPQKKNITQQMTTKFTSQLLPFYMNKSANQLKQILSKNYQSKTGTKSKLATKCADGKQLGRIPTCSKCNGGKLRFDRATEMYKCPGYMEDTDFVHCNEDFRFNEVKRLDWVE